MGKTIDSHEGAFQNRHHWAAHLEHEDPLTQHQLHELLRTGGSRQDLPNISKEQSPPTWRGAQKSLKTPYLHTQTFPERFTLY